MGDFIFFLFIVLENCNGFDKMSTEWTLPFGSNWPRNCVWPHFRSTRSRNSFRHPYFTFIYKNEQLLSSFVNVVVVNIIIALVAKGILVTRLIDLLAKGPFMVLRESCSVLSHGGTLGGKSRQVERKWATREYLAKHPMNHSHLPCMLTSWGASFQGFAKA